MCINEFMPKSAILSVDSKIPQLRQLMKVDNHIDFMLSQSIEEEWQNWSAVLTGYTPQLRKYRDYLLRKRRSLKSDIHRQKPGCASQTKILQKKHFFKLQQMFNARRYTVDDIAKRFRVSTKQIYQYLKEFVANGGSLAARCQEGKTKRLYEALQQLLQKSPVLIQNDIKEQLLQVYGIQASQATISRSIAKLKSDNVAKYYGVNSLQNLHHRQSYCSIYLQDINPTKCLFIDYCSVGAHWLMVVAVSFRQVEEYRVVRSSLGMKNITMFLRENICSQYSDSFIILCNSHFNRQRQLIDLLNQHQIKYIYLPPLSAALNPAQTIFKLLQQHLKQVPKGSDIRVETISFVSHLSSDLLPKIKDEVSFWANKGLEGAPFDNDY